MNTASSTGAQSTNNQPPPSPWKKPKIVSLSKSKSLKRKTELFSSNTTSENNDEFSQPQTKITKNIFNKFSLNTNLTNFNFSNSSNPNSESNDLFSFFNSGKKSQQEEPHKDENTNKPKTDVKLTNLCPQVIKNICSTLSNTSNGSSYETDKQEAKIEPKITYQFENENLIPIDWTLKTRLRFLSSKTFSCNMAIKSQHESEALLNFSKFTTFYSNLEKHAYNSNEKNKDLFKTLFLETISYWTFPYLPWLNLYPRNINVGNLSAEPLNVEIQKSLAKSWNTSFKSLYNSLKSNHCPYFYVLTHSFMVLFKAENLDGNQEMTAILTPSTKGLRQALKDINFTMPLAPAGMKKSDSGDFKTNDTSNSEISTNENSNEKTNKSFNDESDSNLLNNSGQDKSLQEKDEKNDAGEEDDEENDDDCEEPDEWLEQIGLNSTVNFKASILQRNSKNAQKDSTYNFDNRPRSTLLFSEGSDVQALFNYLLNSKSCVSSSGPLTGVPPTLLAPISFVGATLQKIKVEQNVIKSLNSLGEPYTQYAIDLIGPIMPYHIHRLCNLFKATQVEDFSMVGNVYDQTTGLNCVKKKEGEKNLEINSLLDSSELKSLENDYGIYGEAQAIKSISLVDSKFCCNF
ncbi:unnamed protein product [Brachionus calyciflorus]|uniref:Uncharacterized protein n=1 Tax=Brachionus calyciflorus TaxID=104777 RepID=A0A814M5M7_9BILA|nr:unnamed protein product [Brachionus calyciflorus]